MIVSKYTSRPIVEYIRYNEMDRIMTDNVAIQEGYTQEIIAMGGRFDLSLLIKPETDLEDSFRAWDMDEQEFIRVNGWNFEIEDVEAA